MVDGRRESGQRHGSVLELIIHAVRLGQQLRLHARRLTRGEHARGPLEHARGVDCGALHEPEARVAANPLGQTDPSVGGVLTAEFRGHESLGVAEQTLPCLAASFKVDAERRTGRRRQAIEDEREIREAHRYTELLGRDRLEVMGLVDDQRLVGSEHLALALISGEEERVVRDNNGCICRASTRRHHVAARVRPVGARRAEAIGHVGRDPAPELFLVTGEVDLRTVPGRGGREPREDLQLEADRHDVGLVPHHVGGGEESPPSAKAQIVVAPLEDRDGHGLVEQSGDGRQVAVGELFLEIDGVRGHDGPLAGSRRPQRERRQIGE